MYSLKKAKFMVQAHGLIKKKENKAKILKPRRIALAFEQ